MSLDPVKRLASTLAETANEQNEIKQNMSGDDSTGILQANLSENIVVDGTLGLTAIQHTYASDSFILDHSTLGLLDSSVLKLDGGYDPGEGSGIELFNINI